MVKNLRNVVAMVICFVLLASTLVCAASSVVITYSGTGLRDALTVKSWNVKKTSTKYTVTNTFSNIQRGAGDTAPNKVNLVRRNWYGAYVNCKNLISQKNAGTTSVTFKCPETGVYKLELWRKKPSFGSWGVFDAKGKVVK